MFNVFLPFVDDRDCLMLSLLSDFLINNPNKTQYSECKLYAIYGTFPGAIWNGGRSLDHYFPRWSNNHIKKCVNFFNKKNIKIHLTFTNTMLNQSHLSDQYCNEILNIIDNGNDNCVIVASPLLKNYIQKTHPNLKISGSIMAGNHFDIFKQRINEDYDYVVIYPKKEIIEYLKHESQDILNKIEVLLSPSCAHCPIVSKHSDFDSLNNLKQDFKQHYHCYYKDHDIPSNDDLVFAEECLDIGINKFKYSGRGENVYSNLLSSIKRLIKPEYQEETFNYIWNLYINTTELF